MSAHELAEILLNGPNNPVVYYQPQIGFVEVATCNPEPSAHYETSTGNKKLGPVILLDQ